MKVEDALIPNRPGAALCGRQRTHRYRSARAEVLVCRVPIRELATILPARHELLISVVRL
jgi:hypothetical protein